MAGTSPKNSGKIPERPRKRSQSLSWNSPQEYCWDPPNPTQRTRTKNTTTIEKIVNYYAVVFLLRPPNLLRRGPFFERQNVCNSQENGVRTRCAAIVYHSAIVFLVQRGPLGMDSKHLRLPEHFQKSLPLGTAGDASFFETFRDSCALVGQR